MLTILQKFYTRQDIQSILGIGRTKASALLKDSAIESFRYGNEYRVSQDQLNNYMSSIGLVIAPDSMLQYEHSSTLKTEYPDEIIHNVSLSLNTEAELKMEKKKYKKQGNPFKRHGKKGDTWTVRYTVKSNGKSKTKYKGGFKTKTEAEIFKNEVNVSVYSGKYIEPSDITIKDYILEWFQNNYLCFQVLSDSDRQYSANTLQQYNHNIHAHIIPFIGNHKLQHLQKEDIKNLYLKLSAEYTLSANSIRLVNVVLRKALDCAVEDNLIPKNPCNKVWKPTVKRYKSRVLSKEEQLQLQKLLLVKPGTSALPLLILLETGMRRGEALGLRFTDCDHTHNTLKIRQQVTLVDEVKLETGKTKEIYGITEYLKTDAAYRTIDISPELMQIIRKQQHEVRKQKLRAVQYNDLGLVCCHPDGSFLLPKSVYREFKRLLKKNNLPDIRLHDLRGTFITTLHKAGVPLYDIATYVGHEDVSTTAMYLQDTGDKTPICSNVIRQHLHTARD